MSMDYAEALAIARQRFRDHPYWSRLEGTPWENDAPAIAAQLMVLASLMVRPVPGTLPLLEWDIYDEPKGSVSCGSPSTR